MREDKSTAEKNEDASADLEKKCLEAETKLRECQDQGLRIRADFDNVRKRLEREKLESIKYANERLLAEILPIMDNLDRAFSSLQDGHDPEKVKQGLKLAQNELHRVLEMHGVETVKALGKEFDPQFHEAVGIVETDEAQDGVILEEIEKGYLLNGRLVRPSRVKIAQNKKS